MPTLVLDERASRRASLGANGVAHATVQRRFALEELGYPVWGLSPSATPAADGTASTACAFSARSAIRAGAVTPHAAALALAVIAGRGGGEPAPRWPSATRSTATSASTTPSIRSPARSPASYLALDQSMLFLAVANHLKHGGVQRHFAADPIARSVLPLLAAENFFD